MTQRDNMRPWEGHLPCPTITRQGTRCSNLEIEGLGACFQHVPDELLDEAEEITGFRRCRRDFGSATSCRSLAVEGTDPPRCINHGANSGSNFRQGAESRVYEGKLMDRLAAIMMENGDRLLNPPAIGDPLSELLDLAAEIKAGKEALRLVVSHLYSQDRIRYAHSKVGEQLRMEVLLYERALERCAKILIDISKLKIDERLAGIQQQTVDMMERALDMALAEAKMPLERIQPAKETFRRNLRIIKAGAA